jgi:hypothetical protein
LVYKLFAFAAIVGAACLISGVYMINDTAALLSRSQKTTAAVVGYYLQDEVYYPIFDFKDLSGSTVTAQGVDGGTNRMYRIGQLVPILYDSDNPSEGVRANTLIGIWLGPMFLTIMGAFDMVLSLGLYWRKIKAHKSAPPASREFSKF